MRKSSISEPVQESFLNHPQIMRLMHQERENWQTNKNGCIDKLTEKVKEQWFDSERLFELTVQSEVKKQMHQNIINQLHQSSDLKMPVRYHVSFDQMFELNLKRYHDDLSMMPELLSVFSQVLVFYKERMKASYTIENEYFWVDQGILGNIQKIHSNAGMFFTVMKIECYEQMSQYQSHWVQNKLNQWEPIKEAQQTKTAAEFEHYYQQQYEILSKVYEYQVKKLIDLLTPDYKENYFLMTLNQLIARLQQMQINEFEIVPSSNEFAAVIQSNTALKAQDLIEQLCVADEYFACKHPYKKKAWAFINSLQL